MLTSKYSKQDIAIYRDWINAAYRIGKYEGATEPPECPYEDDSKQAGIWYDGFGDGTEDFIQDKYL